MTTWPKREQKPILPTLEKIISVGTFVLYRHNFKKVFLWSMPLFLNTQTMHIKSTIQSSISTFYLENLIPSRGSNPGLLINNFISVGIYLKKNTIKI